MADRDLEISIARIKKTKPAEPSSNCCIDFALGDSGMGVRVILTHPEHEWLMSTSIGVITPDKYSPMPLEEWTQPLRLSASAIADEVLGCFNVDESSKRAEQGHAVVMFRFKEVIGE